MLNLDNNMIKLAVPNKGRLKEPTIELLKNAGYEFRVKDRSLYSTCKNAEMQIIFLRAKDIPVLIANGSIDMGITGQDLVVEDGVEVEEIMPMGYGKCRLCVAVKEEFDEKDLRSLEGKNVATSFPKITEKYFKEQGIKVNCIEMGGALEIMVGLKLADAIVDIVETGDTLRDNKLKVFSEIGSYQTALIANKNAAEHPEVLRIKRRLEGVIIAKKYSLLEYNIHKDKLKEAHEICPGIEAPTISPLDEDDWTAVEIMVEKKSVVEVMDRLQAIGATGIIETEIKNCRM